MMRLSPLSVLASLGIIVFAAAGESAQEPPKVEPVTYRQIDQIFRARCMPCHSNQRKAWGMDLSSYDGLMAGSTNGKVVTPGKPDKSQLVVVIKDTKGLRMPKNGRQLTAAQIKLIETWISEGTKPDAPK